MLLVTLIKILRILLILITLLIVLINIPLQRIGESGYWTYVFSNVAIGFVYFRVGVVMDWIFQNPI